MTDQKPFASLTSGLLARKGAARPAMRPVLDHTGSSLEDLGWNDMGEGSVFDESLSDHVPSSIAALTPAPKPNVQEPKVPDAPPVIEQMRAIEAHFGEAPELEDEAAKAPAPMKAEPDEIEAEAADPVEEEANPAPINVTRPADVVTLPARRAEAHSARDKAAFTLRLDEQRHLKLRLATAVQNRSAQRVVTEALDNYLNALPELDTLAQQVPARQGKRS